MIGCGHQCVKLYCSALATSTVYIMLKNSYSMPCSLAKLVVSVSEIINFTSTKILLRSY